MSKNNEKMVTTGCFGIRGRCVHPQEHRKTIRVIKCDGEVRIYDRPIRAGELMEEFPKHMVCQSDCFYIGQKTSALPQNHHLQAGHNYFLLPANFFQTTLTFALFARCSSNLGSGAFKIEKTPAGSLRIKVSEEYGRQRELEAGLADTLIITTPQLRKDYEQLVLLVRRNHWKPKLDTISEKKSVHCSKKKRKTRKKKASVLS